MISLEAEKVRAPLALSEFAGKKVLIVDDSETNRKILKDLLSQWKMNPLLASSAEAAQDILACTKDFELVLADMDMPGMQGLELAQNISDSHPMLPVILMTSIGSSIDEKQSTMLAGWLPKPIKKATLQNQILNAFYKNKETIKPASLVEVRNFSQEHPLNILVAEDNIINQKVITHILNKLGYTFDLVETGNDVLYQLKNKSYNVILMDIQMPDMDGLEATNIIRNQLDIQPIIIALTASATTSDKEICLQAGMNGYLSKPFKIEELKEYLKKAALQETH